MGLYLLNDQAQLFVPSAKDGASLRVVHNSADAPAVDIVANNQFASPWLKFKIPRLHQLSHRTCGYL